MLFLYGMIFWAKNFIRRIQQRIIFSLQDTFSGKHLLPGTLLTGEII
jgi:hypothetical protein